MTSPAAIVIRTIGATVPSIVVLAARAACDDPTTTEATESKMAVAEPSHAGALRSGEVRRTRAMIGHRPRAVMRAT
ncbi:MAG: hypothetical protein NVSMB21_04120 [Vulcanimicrobiaceae bacterium]